MKVSNTAAFSPFSNGIVERHKAALERTLSKMSQEYEMSESGINRPETALAHAVFAKNSMLKN